MGRTSSPSSTTVLSESDRRFATTSGKNRDRDLPDFALISASSPDLNARQRNPSHLGSNCQPGPSGSFEAVRASIGWSDKGTPRNSQFAPRSFGPSFMTHLPDAAPRPVLEADVIPQHVYPIVGAVSRSNSRRRSSRTLSEASLAVWLFCYGGVYRSSRDREQLDDLLDYISERGSGQVGPNCGDQIRSLGIGRVY